MFLLDWETINTGVLAESVLAHSSVNQGDGITRAMSMSGNLTHWALEFHHEATSCISGSYQASLDHSGGRDWFWSTGNVLSIKESPSISKVFL